MKIDTDELRQMANRRKQHDFPPWVVGARCSVCGAWGMDSGEGCRLFEDVKIDREAALDLADELDELRKDKSSQIKGERQRILKRAKDIEGSMGSSLHNPGAMIRFLIEELEGEAG